jgi:hypothetical protein
VDGLIRRDTDAKIGNIRRSIEDGLADVGWANQRLAELLTEREQLEAATATCGECPQIETGAALAYRHDVDRLMACEDKVASKRLLRELVAEVKLAPDEQEVMITYRSPEPVVHSMVAGACISAMNAVLSQWLVRRWKLPAKGRRRPG